MHCSATVGEPQTEKLYSGIVSLHMLHSSMDPAFGW